MKRYKWILIVLNLALVLVYINYSAMTKEELLRQGQLILLELGTADPRSLMQGDYMTLRYRVTTGLRTDSMSKRGYCIVRLDTQGVAQRLRFQQEPLPLNEGEYALGYTMTKVWSLNIGADSFFFQEGQAEKYNKARYGGIMVDKKGNSLLVGLYDKNRQKIE